MACNKMITHFFHPAAERYSAYIFPIAPIPMSPMEGCWSAGASGVRSGRVMSKVRVDLRSCKCSTFKLSKFKRGQMSESKPQSKANWERKERGQKFRA